MYQNPRLSNSKMDKSTENGAHQSTAYSEHFHRAVGPLRLCVCVRRFFNRASTLSVPISARPPIRIQIRYDRSRLSALSLGASGEITARSQGNFAFAVAFGLADHLLVLCPPHEYSAACIYPSWDSSVFEDASSGPGETEQQ